MTETLEFTGERFTPECVREIWYEHWHRYVFAAQWVAGKRVLDVACGEGYGSDLLARHGANVVGVDLSGAAVEHARQRYGACVGLEFQQADAAALPFAERSFDVVVSFETLEHLTAHEELLSGFARVLRDDGLLIISSPDKRTYSDARAYSNEHHLRELYRDEFETLLARHFASHRLFGQKLLFQSTIWSLDGPPVNAHASTAITAAQVEAGIALDPLYFIALATKTAVALPAGLERSISLFTDASESVYSHYDHEVRKNIAAGGRIVELETQCARLQADYDALRAVATATAAVEPGDDKRSRWRRWWSSR